MTSGSAAGAVKSVTTLACQGPSNDWLRAGDSHDVQGTLFVAHTQDEYTAAAESRSRFALSLQPTCKRSPYTLLEVASLSLMPIARPSTMVSNGNDFNTLGALKINDAEGELVQQIAAVLRVDTWPAPG